LLLAAATCLVDATLIAADPVMLAAVLGKDKVETDSDDLMVIGVGACCRRYHDVRETDGRRQTKKTCKK